jgi:hypothetical protein
MTGEIATRLMSGVEANGASKRAEGLGCSGRRALITPPHPVPTPSSFRAAVFQCNDNKHDGILEQLERRTAVALFTRIILPTRSRLPCDARR